MLNTGDLLYETASLMHSLRSGVGKREAGRAILGKRHCNGMGKISVLWQTQFIQAVHLLCGFFCETVCLASFSVLLKGAIKW